MRRRGRMQGWSESDDGRKVGGEKQQGGWVCEVPLVPPLQIP